MRVPLRLLLSLAFLACLLPSPISAQSDEPERGKPGAEEGNESEAILERARLYLRRHGDGGRIDPERRLRAVAADYTSRVADERLRKSPLAVDLSWVSLGPNNGAGRMTALAPHPTVSGTVYAGAAGGGVWKTTDSGATWAPLSDGINDLSVGALGIAPSSPSTLYLGTGEGGYAIDFIPGIGLLKSTDGGVNWTLPASVIATTFYRIAVHPTIADELVIGTNQGGLRSTNGGTSFTPVIAKATYGDVTDIVRDPVTSSILYAATWRGPYDTTDVSKVLKSTDSGATWNEKSVGLPTSLAAGYNFYERFALSISASNPMILYASTTVFDGVSELVSHVYKTTNSGDTWSDLTAVSTSGNSHVKHFMASQSWYNNTIVVSPSSANVVFAGGTYYVRSTNGGTGFAEPNVATYPHVDAHDTRYQGSTLWVANDGGIWTSTDEGATFTDRTAGLVTRQYYALAIDPVNRNRMLGGAQDNGTTQRTDAGGTSWRAVIGGDGFECGVNGNAPGVAYGTVQYGNIYRTTGAGSVGLPVFNGINPAYSDDDAVPFLTLLTLDPSVPGTLYTGTDRVWKSSDGGNGWVPLPTTSTPSNSWNGVGIWSMAVSKSDGKVLLVAKGSQVFATTDGGTAWTLASSGLPGANINNLEIDTTNSSLAYAALATTSGTSVYRTTNRGTSWTARATGLPNFAAQVIRVDPTNSNVLYCGTDVGVYRSIDQGGSWAKYGTGLPNSSVHDMRILEDASMLRVATHGRGMWELQIPASGNASPIATITVPGGPVTVAKGTTLGFVGKVTDADGSATGTWTFTDVFEAQGTLPGSSSRRHVFFRSGVFPISLAAKDNHGAIGVATVTVTVSEPADACSAATVIPGAGPFPYTLIANTEAGTSQGTDPQPSCVGGGIGKQGSIWFQFTPAVSGTYEISTCGASFDTVLSAYTGAACGPYVSVGCNDDAASVCAGTTASALSVAGTSGVPLRIMVGGYLTTDAGTFPLTIRLTTTPAGSPRIALASRSGGLVSGGDLVVLTGASFVSGATASFGGTPAATTFVNPTLISAVTPAHAAGTVDIVVTNLDASTGTLGGGFTYVTAQLHGDVNGDGTVDISDVFNMINAIFAAGPLAPLEISDANGDLTFDISDVFYMINYIFAHGPGPK